MKTIKTFLRDADEVKAVTEILKPFLYVIYITFLGLLIFNLLLSLNH